MILVSACLLGINCKYNGDNNKNEKVAEYLKDKQFIMVCPEQLGGLSTPRDPSEIYGCKKAILKEGSPSCGSSLIYDGTFTGKKVSGVGVTTALLRQNGIEVISEKDIM